MKKWRCIVCGYIHEGPTPPDVCPVCGVGPEEFEEVVETPAGEKPDLPVASVGETKNLGPIPGGNQREAIFKIGYGLYVATSKKDGRFNGQVCNTVFQITSDPQRVAVALNTDNLTNEFVKSSGLVTINILGKGNFPDIKRFGYQSGHKVDKFEGYTYAESATNGLPILLNASAYLDLKIDPEMVMEVGTHTLFVGEVVDGGLIRDGEPITYDFYRANRAKSEARLENDVQNVVSALNLEYGANRRYQYQLEKMNNPRINAALEGIMRTEGDHMDTAEKFLRQKLVGANTGFDKTLLHLRLNLEFEEIAAATYKQFAKEAFDEKLKDNFKKMNRSELGHVNIFKKMIEAIEKGEYPVAFYCPLCGWEIEYGTTPKEGDAERCARCGQSYALKMVEGEWTLVEA